LATLLFFFFVQSRFAHATSHQLRQHITVQLFWMRQKICYFLLATKAAKSKGIGREGRWVYNTIDTRVRISIATVGISM
jgi:hypothetical protein